MNRGYTFLWRKTWANPLFQEKGKSFSHFEAWLYLTNVLATGMDDEAAGLKRGDFIVSVRYLARCFNWSHGMAQRFLDLLLENSMISRVVRPAVHPAVQETGHFIVCNYGTYNPARYTRRNSQRYADRYKIKEVVKEGLKEVEKYTHLPAPSRRRGCVPENPRRNLPATQPGAARGEGTDRRKAEEVQVKD